LSDPNGLADARVKETEVWTVVHIAP
jgi:hypothetical protein